MGRLRNLSESFKGMTFLHSNNSDSSPSFTKPEPSPQSTDFNSKELPAIAREASGSSIPQTTPPTTRYGRSASRPTSMIYTPPSIGVGVDMHIEELVPVFSFLSSHANKLYQEGYFLKLNDLDTNGKPNADRNWTECFAQLVGTVLSLWDAAALDAAGQDGEVAPTFINLADASIKMIETLPTRNQDVQPLQNVLSISTAGKNRYLLHFNSLHSLTQWTASIRLAMFEHGSLQELYTGSLIAGKGKHLNNIRMIMERTKFRHEDWARVRFGAGTPWRRCWCVIEPPDEKEWQRATKTMKKRSAYERPAYPKGDIKFYDTKKTKKATPIATITDAYSAYAIYPQSKPLIDQSTLVKVEGRITIHSTPESKTEGFVFVMPEVHPAVSGFEMMLRWLFPVYDCFHLYGRPSRLIADTLDARGLMFAMPKERRYGYLEIIDVAALIHTEGSEKWSEREWRKQMKEMTSRRMTNAAQSRPSNAESTRNRNSMGSRNGVRYDDSASVRSTPSTRQGHQHNLSTDAVFGTPKKAVTGPPGSLNTPVYHNRSVSESVTLSPSKVRRQGSPRKPSGLSVDHGSFDEVEAPPAPPVHRNLKPPQLSDSDLVDSRNSSDSDLAVQRTRSHAEEVGREMGQQTPPGPVAAPPTFHHQANDRPQKQPDQRPQMRREKSRLSNATLEQLVDASRAGTNGTNGPAGLAATVAWRSRSQTHDQAPRGVNQPPTDSGISANQNAYKAMVAGYPRAEAGVKPSETSPPTEPRPFITQRSASEHSIKRKPLPSLAPPMPGEASRSRSADHNARHSRERDRDSSPDYASTRKSEDVNPEKPFPRARTGVLKTVGDPDLNSDAPPVPPKSDIPDIDFGVTKSLTPGHSRSNTALGTLGRRSPLDGLEQTTPERSSPRTPGLRTPEGLTPNDSRRSSYFENTSPGAGHVRSGSTAWQPPKPVGRQSPGPGMSAEEFVQQRYAAANRPTGYDPRRSVSSSTIEKIATAPKKLQKKRDSRPSSRNSLLNTDYSSNLSAREQEHVARMTGGPLLNLHEQKRVPDPSVGLIGAIEAREQEKRNIKDGVSGHMVQAAIAQRQQQVQAQQFQAQQIHAQQAAEMAYTQRYPPNAQSQNGYGQQQWASQSQPQLQQQYTSWGMPIRQQAPQQVPQQQQYQQQYQQPYQGYANQAQGYQNREYQQKYGGYYQG